MPLPELALIEKIRTLAAKPSRRVGRSRIGSGAVYQGIGDDCAVLAGSSAEDLLVTTDLCIQDVHFRLEWHPPSWVGHRCLLRGLSDIAAMGGEPTAAFVSLAIPAELPQRWVDQFLKGLLHLAGRFAVVLAGGDIAASRNGIAADVVVIGRVPKGKAILRSGARPGDLIYVSGVLGRSTEALLWMQSRQKKARGMESVKPGNPGKPRLELGQWLRRRNKATAMIDISDGLSTDLTHICTESRVSARLFREAIPFDRSRKRTFEERFEEDARRYAYAMYGGEDYELMFTAPHGKPVPGRIAGTQITKIGEVLARKPGTGPITVVYADGRVEPLSTTGWEHFSSSGIADR